MLPHVCVEVVWAIAERGLAIELLLIREVILGVLDRHVQILDRVLGLAGVPDLGQVVRLLTLVSSSNILRLEVVAVRVDLHDVGVLAHGRVRPGVMFSDQRAGLLLWSASQLRRAVYADLVSLGPAVGFLHHPEVEQRVGNELI